MRISAVKIKVNVTYQLLLGQKQQLVEEEKISTGKIKIRQNTMHYLPSPPCPEAAAGRGRKY